MLMAPTFKASLSFTCAIRQTICCAGKHTSEQSCYISWHPCAKIELKLLLSCAALALHKLHTCT